MTWAAIEVHPNRTEMWVNLKLVASIDQTNHAVLLLDGSWYTVTDDFQSLIDALEGCDVQ